MSSPLTNRHDILILFEVTNGNPNGDPDSGNQPRVDPSTNRGLVSDVCLKRKVRNFVQLFPPLVQRQGIQDPDSAKGPSSNREQKKGDRGETEKPGRRQGTDKRLDTPERVKDWLCEQFYDVRTFGQVISTGERGHEGLDLRPDPRPGPVHLRPSFDPMLARQEITITRCAVTKEEDVAKERTMGQKYIVPYGTLRRQVLRLARRSPSNTGFDQEDYDLSIEALTHLFDHDRSAARGDMVVRGLFDFEHVGTQSETNAEQNQSRGQARLCPCPSNSSSRSRSTSRRVSSSPQSFADYT